LVRGAPERIFYLATHLTGPDAAVDARIRSSISDRGYRVSDEARVVLGRLLVFARSGAASDPSPARR